jgi:hypothetical protein
MNKKETWIDETLNSFDGLRKATAGPELIQKLHTAVYDHACKQILMRRPIYWSVAAGLAILVTLNVFTALYAQKKQTRQQEIPSAIASEYLSYMGKAKL